VVVGPNIQQGRQDLTGYCGWQTPNGVWAPTRGGILPAGGRDSRKDEEALAGEHSIGGGVPFIGCFLPEAKIVPVILHHDVGLREVKELLKTLAPYLTDSAVLVSSVDFSHYLTRSEAQAKDQETLRYMRNFDYQALMGLGSDYLDSPASLAAAFSWLKTGGSGSLPYWRIPIPGFSCITILFRLPVILPWRSRNKGKAEKIIISDKKRLLFLYQGGYGRIRDGWLEPSKEENFSGGIYGYSIFEGTMADMTYRR
jgi:hypothetical protein